MVSVAFLKQMELYVLSAIPLLAVWIAIDWWKGRRGFRLSWVVGAVYALPFYVLWTFGSSTSKNITSLNLLLACIAVIIVFPAVIWLGAAIAVLRPAKKKPVDSNKP